MNSFRDRLSRAVDTNRSMLCVGLDPDPALMAIPDVAVFNRAIVDATKDLVCAYKPNMSFYEALGADGLRALRETIDHIRRVAPSAIVVSRRETRRHRLVERKVRLCPLRRVGLRRRHGEPVRRRRFARPLPRIRRPRRLRAVPDVESRSRRAAGPAGGRRQRRTAGIRGGCGEGGGLERARQRRAGRRSDIPGAARPGPRAVPRHAGPAAGGRRTGRRASRVGERGRRPQRQEPYHQQLQVHPLRLHRQRLRGGREDRGGATAQRNQRHSSSRDGVGLWTS